MWSLLLDEDVVMSTEEKQHMNPAALLWERNCARVCSRATYLNIPYHAFLMHCNNKQVLCTRVEENPFSNSSDIVSAIIENMYCFYSFQSWCYMRGVIDMFVTYDRKRSVTQLSLRACAGQI